MATTTDPSTPLAEEPPSQPKLLKRIRRFKRLRLSAVGLLTAAIALGIQAVGGWRLFDNASYVLLFRARQAIAPLQWDSRVAVIAIDDHTLSGYGQFPISRRYYIDLLDYLIVAQPAAVGFDLLFADPSPYDQAFVEAISRQWTVILPVTANAQGNTLPPVPLLAAAAAGQGHVLVTPDRDGITRSVETHQGDVPAFGLALLQTYRESQTATAADDALNLPAIAKGPQPIPQTLWLNWPAPVQAPVSCATPGPDQLSVYSMDCVLSGQVSPDAFRNRIVLIGVTATAIDSLRTPFDLLPPTANVYLHAAVIDNLIAGRSLTRLPDWGLIPIVVLAGLGTVGLINSSRLRLALGLPLAWGLLAFLGLLAHVWLPVAAPIGTILLAAAGTQASAQWEKQQLMELFSIHVDPTTAKLLWQQRDHILQNGELPLQDLVATVLFIDIRGFTTVAEQLSSKTLMHWLNQYLNAITEQITIQGGRVDKFIGDEVMAYFGTPTEQADAAAIGGDATRAIEACLKIHEQVQRLNQKLLQDGYAPINIGTGIHTGAVTAGSVGNRQRLNYSIVGDTVNVAARLEELNKVVVAENPYSLLLTEATRQALGNTYPCRRVGSFKLKGRLQRVSVYALQQGGD